MIERQLKGRDITDPSVLKAMNEVPRHRFVPMAEQSHAYADSPVPIGYGQTISQPYIVALMTQLADIRPGMSVLEVGTGSGYQAAVAYELTDRVYTVEIIAPLTGHRHQSAACDFRAPLIALQHNLFLKVQQTG